MKRAFLIIWNCDRKALLIKLFYTACNSLLPLVNLYVLKVIVDVVTEAVTHGVENPSGWLVSEVMPAILLFSGITLLNRLIKVFGTVNNDVLTQKLIDYINKLIQDQSSLLDMAYYDNPEYHDTFHRAQQEAAFRPVRILENMMSVFSSVISLAGVAAMLFVASWQVIAIMIVAVVPAFIVKLYKSRKIYQFRRETTQLSRRSNYYGMLLTNRIYAKEVRSFGLADYFRSRYVEIRGRLVERLLHISRRLALLDALTALIEAAALVAVLILLVRPLFTGVMTIGSFVMLFEAFRRGQSYLTSLVEGIGGLYEHKLFINNLFDFLELKPSILSPAKPVAFPAEVDEVFFDNITFSYPDMNHPTIKNFSLKAKRGEVTYLEGENGFGKTTLLKLLLRLYDPQGGAVRINGIDIREFDVDELRRNISAVFQDYVQYHLTLRENIVLGDINNADDARRLAEAIRLADAERVVAKLDKGLDAQLGRQFNGGEELSMGQWQRVALARQLYSPADILIFDEPTAWMDAEACRHFMQSLEELRNGRIILLVRHKERI